MVENRSLEELRAAYLQEVVAALAEYIGLSGEVRLQSHREADELCITFTLTAAEHYQELLARLTGSESAGPR